MRGIAVVVTGLSLCVAANACGGSSDAFVSTPADAGADGTMAVGADDGGPGTGDLGDGDGRTTPTTDAAAPVEDGGQASANKDGGAATTTDAGPTTRTDAAPDADGAAPDAPAGVSCGSATCSTGQFCCAELDGGAACTTSEQACTALAGVPRRCEKTADCPTNNVCCFEFSSFPATTSCHANDCNGGGGTRVQACQTQGDCAAGTCAVHVCVDGGSIQSCAAFGTECP
jgi:hypothetical protein